MTHLTSLAILAALVIPGAVIASGPDEVTGSKDFGWCCSKADCRAAKPGEIKWTSAGWHVEGLEGYLNNGDKGLKWISSNKSPWFCEFPKTKVRCIFLPRTGG